MKCREFLNLMEAYSADTLEGPHAADFREHLRSCAACRDEAVAADPVLLLSAAPVTEPSAAEVQACVGAVNALIHQDRLQKRMSKPRWRWMAAAAALVVSLGAGAAWWSKPDGIDEGGLTPLQGPVSVATHREEPPPPRVEVQTPGGDLRVYQYADAGDGNTAVVYIVRESLEL